MVETGFVLPHFASVSLQETVDLVKQIDGHSRLVDVSHAAFVWDVADVIHDR